MPTTVCLIQTLLEALEKQGQEAHEQSLSQAAYLAICLLLRSSTHGEWEGCAAPGHCQVKAVTCQRPESAAFTLSAFRGFPQDPQCW